MIITRFGHIPFLFALTGVILLLNACAGMAPAPPADDQGTSPDAAEVQEARFIEWSTKGKSVDSQNQQIVVPPVVIKLASQADAHIAKSDWQAASDTLERLLRIAPDYAPGWSRMAWLAISAGDAERARQMAARSNSYAAGRKDLKILNWELIRDASLKLNDRTAVQRAERNIEALGNM